MNGLSRNVFFHYLLPVALSLFFMAFSGIGYSAEPKNEDAPWTIYYSPGVRFGTDDRTLYINDFLVPLYQDERNVLFSNIKYTPNNRNGWEVNLGLGYRRLLLDDRLILGINCFYDRRKTLWDSIHEQWGVGTEVMADVPIGNLYFGITGRFNYYRPLTSARIDTSFTEGNEFRGTKGVRSFFDTSSFPLTPAPGAPARTTERSVKGRMCWDG